MLLHLIFWLSPQVFGRFLNILSNVNCSISFNDVVKLVARNTIEIVHQLQDGLQENQGEIPLFLFTIVAASVP